MSLRQHRGTAFKQGADLDSLGGVPKQHLNGGAEPDETLLQFPLG
jgi:hypothetical protein